MPRPHKCRYVFGLPEIQAFKPAGIPGQSLETIELRLDELEAIRLADLEGFYHEGAAQRMGISRATFGRVLVGAHQKIADAIINGKMLSFKGGNVAGPTVRTFICDDCGYHFSVSFGENRPGMCPRCQSVNIRRILESHNGDRLGGGNLGPGRRCRRFRGGRSRGRQ